MTNKTKSIEFMAASSFLIPVIFLSTFLLVNVRSVEVHFDSAGAGSVQGPLPIVMPTALGKPDSEGKYKIEITDRVKDACLLYIESVSVVLFNFKENQKQSAWAVMNMTNTKGYNGEMKCPEQSNVGTQFSVDLIVNANDIPGYYTSDLLRKDESKVVFKVSKVDISLKFNFTQPAYWQLVDAIVNEIQLSDGTATGIPKISSDSILVTGRGSKGWLDDKHAAAWNINGFKDYAYSCSRTNPIVWANPKENDYAVGVALNNIQMQLNATSQDKDKDGGKYYARFGFRVNDCAPLFSIGTWMGLIVAILLIGVLSFGFLMLNSVQTMDRFDDPKQKQLIINAKE